MKWSNVSQLAFCTLTSAIALHPFEPSVQAIVINDTAGAATAQMLGAPFTSITQIFIGGSLCSGALISPLYVLTAQHCIFGEDASNVTVLFQNSDPLNTLLDEISVANIFEIDATDDLLDGTDVAILELSSPSPEFITPLKFLTDAEDFVGSTATLVGFGFSGVGSTGYQNYDGLRWAAENVIDLFDGAPVDGFIIPDTFNIFSTDFDDGTAENNTLASIGSSTSPLLNEGTTAPGDSGSPLLVNYNDEWLIAGVLSGGSSPTSQYGDISWWTGTEKHQSFIEQFGGKFVHVPEPSSVLALMTVGAIGAGMGRVRKRLNKN